MVRHGYTRSNEAGIAWARLIGKRRTPVLYLNSLFNPVYTLLPLLARRLAGSQRKPVIVAPRGEFSTGALGLKRWKKRPFLIVAQIAGLYRNVLWHASTEDEAQMIRRQFGGTARIVIARNLPPMSGQQGTSCEAIDASGPLRIVFLSRISRKKNLDYALRVLSKTRVRIQFDIWGTLEDPAYWKGWRIRYDLPENVVAITVAWRIFRGKKILPVMTCFPPDRGENMGCIDEAVSAGRGMLSDQNPWRNLHVKGSVGLPWKTGRAAFRKR